MPSAVTKLEPYKLAIEQALDDFLVRAPKLFAIDQSQQGHDALAHLREYSLRPGKRIRGTLAALAYDTAANTELAPQAIQLGVVLELMQAYLLIIDDVMDQSALRRGRPTLHELYKAQAHDKHTAEMLAVNVGCLAQHLANIQLSQIDVPSVAFQQAFAILHRNIGITGFGQLDDLHQLAGGQVSEADVLRKYRNKSSYYTFVNPLQLGFALAGTGDFATMTACAAFGVPAGIAFQLHDDYLGIWGDASKHGKSNLDDIREGKYTLLMHYALQHAEGRDEEVLSAALGNPDANEQDLEEVRLSLQNTGAADYNVVQLQKYVTEAKATLDAKPLGDPAMSATLNELLDYVITREQ